MEQFQPSPIEVNAALSHIAGRQEERMTAEAQSRTYAERIAAVTAAMHKTKSGAVAKDVHNTYKGVTETPGLDHLFAKNTLTGDIVTRYEYDTRKYGFGDIRIQAGVKIDETELARIWRLLNSIYGVDFGLERVRSAVNESANRCRFNPILNYLKSLKWDGTPRIDTWLIDCAGAEDSQ
jgi:predicted P-loop ATPase